MAKAGVKQSLQKAGSFTVEKIEVITSRGAPINLLGKLMHITFYEDIQSDSVVGECLINDLLALSTMGPIIGQEYLSMRIQTNSPDKVDAATFDFTENLLLINSLQMREDGASGNQFLLLEFSTSELQKDQRIRINQSYTGSYSDIFISIMKDHLKSRKKLFVEPSAGTKKIIFPNFSPFEAIHMMKRQAVSSHDRSPTYMFFEDLQGYHFRSLSSMYAQPPILTYETSVPGSKELDAFSDLTSVIKHEVKAIGDSAAAQRLGSYGSELITYDTYTRRHITTIYNYLDNFDDETHVTAGKKTGVEQFPLISETPVQDELRMSDFSARRYLVPTANYVDGDNNYTDLSVLHDSDGEFIFNSTRPETWLQRRQSQLYQLEKGITCTITTNGNTLVDCGDIINFNLPSVAAAKAEENRKFDFFYRGRFLVRRIRQDFDLSTQKHQSIMTLVKDSLESELPSLSQSLETQTQDSGEIVQDFYNSDDED
tara:strand:- start:62 stop:1513 length:1452 start_codon:yes stop_codon:yes gene_type:complete